VKAETPCVVHSFQRETKVMVQNNGRAKRSEKGLLTPDNC
jgi:hypothetical protein